MSLNSRKKPYSNSLFMNRALFTPSLATGTASAPAHNQAPWHGMAGDCAALSACSGERLRRGVYLSFVRNVASPPKGSGTARFLRGTQSYSWIVQENHAPAGSIATSWRRPLLAPTDRYASELFFDERAVMPLRVRRGIPTATVVTLVRSRQSQSGSVFRSRASLSRRAVAGVYEACVQPGVASSQLRRSSPSDCADSSARCMMA
jgi:hypothetical protein